MKKKKNHFWRILRIFLGVILGIVLLLLTTVTVILVTPGARTAVLNKCVKEVNERVQTAMTYKETVYLYV